MKESLKALFFNETEQKNPFPKEIFKLSDEELLKKSLEIRDLLERETFLIDSLSKAPDHYIESSKHLISLIKKKNPQYAFDIAIKLKKFYNLSPIPLWLITRIAMEHNAFKVAKSAVEIAEWLCFKEYKTCLNETLKLKKELDSISNKNKDISENLFWESKVIEKYPTLLNLYSSLDPQNTYEYSIRLLETFPKQEENYEAVLEILNLIDNEDLFVKFLDFINSQDELNPNNKNLYLGILNLNLSKYTDSIELLKNVTGTNETNFASKFYSSISYLLSGDKEQFLSTFNELISYPNISKESVDEIITKSTGFFLAIFTTWNVLNESPFKINNLEKEKEASERITSKVIAKLLRSGRSELANEIIDKFIEQNYQKEFPSLFLHLAELFISENQLARAKELLGYCSQGEKHRLYSWIYRIEGNENKAEEELSEYRKTIDITSKPLVIYKVTPLNLPKILPTSEKDILSCLNDIYKDLEDKKNKLALKYGINRNTCFESNCLECCTKTFPCISYTEYLYMRRWLDKQPEEIKEKILQQSLKIVENYKKEYKKEPPFLGIKDLDNRYLYYPRGFSFECPALSETGCIAYEGQPFMCRVYGFGSSNKVQFQGCNYFQDQYLFATGLTLFREVIDILSFSKFAQATDASLIETKVLAPIPVWFAQGHAETVWKAKLHILSKGIMSPLYKFATKIYLKKLQEVKK